MGICSASISQMTIIPIILTAAQGYLQRQSHCLGAERFMLRCILMPKVRCILLREVMGDMYLATLSLNTIGLCVNINFSAEKTTHLALRNPNRHEKERALYYDGRR